jgi:hypothetical protein
MRILAFVTPVNETETQIFFWRIRNISGLAAEAWRFLYRTTFEVRHWRVLEQDRSILMDMPSDAREREALYQQDIGVTRLRQIFKSRARAQIDAEQRQTA